MTDAERRAALEAIAEEVRVCIRCRLHEGRTQAVPGEGHPATEVMFVGEGPGFNEDRLGRPFVGRAGDLLVRLLGSIGWRREEVFITNVVKCRPPDNRDPYPDEIAACEPFLRRQLSVLEPALVVTLGRHSMGRFMPGARISQAHGTIRPADPETGARDALVFAMYHPAAALRTPAIERTSFQDIGAVPNALLDARHRREEKAAAAPVSLPAAVPPPTVAAVGGATASVSATAVLERPVAAEPAASGPVDVAGTVQDAPPPGTPATTVAPPATAELQPPSAEPDPTDQLPLF